TEQS
ncbi:hypothetical protein EC940618_0296, partial [Escherichia coli 94.0618]